MSGQPLKSHRSQRLAGGPRNGRSNAVWIVGFILTAEVGGLAAAALTHESMLRALVIPLAVAAIVAGVLWTGALDPPRSTRRHGASATGGQSAVRAGERAAPDAPVRPAASARDSQPYAWSWPLSADGADSAAAPAPAAPAVAEPAPVRPGLVRVLQDHGTSAGPLRTEDLSRFLGQVVIAQCPHCAAFRIDANAQPLDWAFACHDCGLQWTWRPGTPWPEVHVRPDERRRSSRRSS